MKVIRGVRRLSMNIKHTISAAPMLDVTDRFQRYLMRRITKHMVLYTEMVVANTIHYQTDLIRRSLLAFDSSEHPIVCQIGGSDPEMIAETAVLVAQEGYDEININCGCPSPKVAKGHFGASLMLDPLLVANIVKSTKNHVNIPVTIKCRLGVDDHDTYEELYKFIDITQSQGVNHYIIHCRKALLNGINPKKNRSIPPLMYDWVYKLMDDFPHLQFTLNGGVESLNQGSELLKRKSEKGRELAGIMYGRLIYKNPLHFRSVDSLFYNSQDLKPSRASLLYEYLEYIKKLQNQKDLLFPNVSILVHPLYNLFYGVPHSNQFKSILHTSIFHDRYTLQDSIIRALECISPEDFYDTLVSEEDIKLYKDYFQYSKTLSYFILFCLKLNHNNLSIHKDSLIKKTKTKHINPK